MKTLFPASLWQPYLHDAAPTKITVEEIFPLTCKDVVGHSWRFESNLVQSLQYIWHLPFGHHVTEATITWCDDNNIMYMEDVDIVVDQTRVTEHWAIEVRSVIDFVTVQIIISNLSTKKQPMKLINVMMQHKGDY